ncbi:MAG: hypothetical protein M1820_002741 [Bogoriella megaspora]|nr:MAG: hypothetical protein M1820_002741 [Bogoriella megaspora]
MSSPKILLTGATGYIGGSILAQLTSSTSIPFPITCLVRGDDRVTKLKQTYGDKVNPVLFKDLDDTDRIIEIASSHDLAINTTLGYHPESAASVVHGLAKRKQTTGRDVWVIHTSGTSNLADTPLTHEYPESNAKRVFDDSVDDVYSYEKARNASSPYAQRTAELGVVDAGLQTGVRTLVIMSPTIYGLGTGLFNRTSIQVPGYIAGALAEGQAVVIGDGAGVWDHVHVEDLAVLYELCVRNVVEKGGSDLPYGKKGIIFSENGVHSWKELAQHVADVAFDEGKVESKEVKSVGLQEGAKVLAGGSEEIAELGLSSNSRTKGVIARKLGWKPTRGEEAWRESFKPEVQEYLRTKAK